MPHKHEWKTDNQAFMEQAARRHARGDTKDSYRSSHVIHYWAEDACPLCGEKRLLSSIIDKDGAAPLSDWEFLWLTLFVTQLNEDTGYIEEKKKLIHYAIDQQPWQYFPKIKMPNPEKDVFSISFKNDRFKRFAWSYRDAYLMFEAMNARALLYIPREQITPIDSPFTELEQLKAEYRTLMEIATQSGLTGKVQDDLQALRQKLRSLTYALNEFIDIGDSDDQT